MLPLVSHRCLCSYIDLTIWSHSYYIPTPHLAIFSIPPPSSPSILRLLVSSIVNVIWAYMYVCVCVCLCICMNTCTHAYTCFDTGEKPRSLCMLHKCSNSVTSPPPIFWLGYCFILFSFVWFLSYDRVSLCRPGCPITNPLWNSG